MEGERETRHLAGGAGLTVGLFGLCIDLILAPGGCLCILEQISPSQEEGQPHFSDGETEAQRGQAG